MTGKQPTDVLASTSTEFTDGFVSENLETILLILIAENGETNGAELTNQIERLFGVTVSSGTLYPQLYDLRDDGLIESEELISTVEYRINDFSGLNSQITEFCDTYLTLIEAISHLEPGKQNKPQYVADD